ncbi:sigma 54-interacting transcriptional regulator [bacterium]|nr:sigma 54-interacting transcriptional regulator [bacterium]
MAATNENVQKAIQKGKFREDLFYKHEQIDVSFLLTLNSKSRYTNN